MRGKFLLVVATYYHTILTVMLCPLSKWHANKVTLTWVQIHRHLRESNVTDTETFCAQFNERNWFSYVYVSRIVARIDSLILVEFAGLLTFMHLWSTCNCSCIRILIALANSAYDVTYYHWILLIVTILCFIYYIFPQESCWQYAKIDRHSAGSQEGAFIHESKSPL